jgi:RNA polymerase sigma factor (sigma-70 family)
MTTPITNYTTYDLAYYYADLRRLPRLSREDRKRLVTSMSGVPPSPATSQETQVKQRLIEGYLSFAKHLAITLCPPSLYQRLFPDLLGAANLAMVEAVTRCDLATIADLTAYLTAWVRGAIKRTLTRDDLLPIPSRVREQARAEGTLEHLYAQHRIASLEALMAWFDTDEVEEPPVTPILPTEAAPPRDPQQRAQVETLLSYLSPRAQAIMRLRYGLSDDNERSHGTTEIAHLLGIRRTTVQLVERDAIARLRALVAGKATLVKRHGKLSISYPARDDRPLKPEQEAALTKAYRELQAQAPSVSGRLLAQVAGVSQRSASTFLRLHRTETPKAARARARQQKLEEVWRRLDAQGVRITGCLLAREARVMKQTTTDFLKARRGESHAAH